MNSYIRTQLTLLPYEFLVVPSPPPLCHLIGPNSSIVLEYVFSLAILLAWRLTKCMISKRNIYLSLLMSCFMKSLSFSTNWFHTNLTDPLPTLVLSSPTSDIPTTHSSVSNDSQIINTSDPQLIISQNLIPLRRSSRANKPLSDLREYHCHMLNHQNILPHTQLYPLS